MPTRVYTLLGWVVWQAVSRLAKKKTDQKKVKLGAGRDRARRSDRRRGRGARREF